jgi:hypothetical protein
MMVIRTGAEREGWGCIGRDIPLFPCYPARGGPQREPAVSRGARPLVSFPSRASRSTN